MKGNYYVYFSLLCIVTLDLLNMNKWILIIVFSLTSFLIHSQTKEFSFSYSPLSAYRLGHTEEQYETSHFVLGAFNFDYYGYVNDWLKVGANLMYDREKINGSFGSSGILTYEITNSVLVIAPQVDFEYLHNPNFRLSSGLSLGYASVFGSRVENQYSKGNTQTGNKTGFIFHLNLISFRWGRKNGLCGYMGMGHKGFLGLGYFVRL